jgi:hypothetical protein
MKMTFPSDNDYDASVLTGQRQHRYMDTNVLCITFFIWKILFGSFQGQNLRFFSLRFWLSLHLMFVQNFP